MKCFRSTIEWNRANYKLYDSGLDVVLGIADYVSKEVSEYIIDTDTVIIHLED